MGLIVFAIGVFALYALWRGQWLPLAAFVGIAWFLGVETIPAVFTAIAIFNVAYLLLRADPPARHTSRDEQGRTQATR